MSNKSKLHLVKKLGDAIAQPFAQKLLANYEAMTRAGKLVSKQKILYLGNKGPALSSEDLPDVLIRKFSEDPMFRQQILNGFELDNVFHFAFNPSGLVELPLQADCILQEGQTLDVEAFGWALRDPVNKKVYIYFKGTNFESTEILASTGTAKVGFNNDDTILANDLVKGMPGLAKGSNGRWLLSSVKYKGEDGKECVFIKSMAEQMREYAQRKDLEGYEVILVGHSVGATELAIMFAYLSINQPHLLSTLGLCIGSYRFLSKEAVDWLNNIANGTLINIINGNDSVPLASTIGCSLATAYLSRPDITEEVLQKLLKANSFWLPGQTFGFQSMEGVGLTPWANHNIATYGLAFRPENYGLILPLEDGLEGLFRFKSKYGDLFQPIEPRTKEDQELIAMLKQESEGYIHN